MKFTVRTVLGRLILILFILGPAVCRPAESANEPAEAGLKETVNRLAQEYRAETALGGPAQRLGAALTKTGQTWLAVSLDLSRKLEDLEARSFLNRAEKDHQLRLARDLGPENVQISGLNLLYQSLSALAFMLARTKDDEKILEEIQSTEQRILAVIDQGGAGPSALAALSGGVLTMLAFTARQVDDQGRMAETLSAELDRRRAVDANIYRLEKVGPRERMLLLTNNHLHGALSMVQIIGLALDEKLKGDLRRIEAELIKTREADLESQILAGAQGLAQAGFLVAPAFQELAPLGRPGPATDKTQ